MDNLYRQPSASMMSNVKKLLTVPLDQMNSPALNNTTIQQALSEQRKVAQQRVNSDKKKAADQKNTSDPKKASDLTLQMRSVTIPSTILPKNDSEVITQERLQEAVIWSEILGKPLSRRRKRRM